MIEKIKSINIKGEFFSDLVEWNFQSIKDKDRLFLIYGNNGSGKTTFSKAVFEYKNSIDGKFKNFEEIYFKDELDNVITLDKNNIWSFNDEFIQKNVRIKNSGINAIVMFGEAGDIDKQLNEYEIKKAEINNKLKLIDLDKYITPKSVFCINDVYNSIINNLKNEWASNDKSIKGSQRNTSVTGNTITKIINLSKPKNSINKLKSIFEEKLKLYKSLPTNKEIITSSLYSDWKFTSEDEIMELLAKKINQPIYGELENRIIKAMNRTENLVDIQKTENVLNNFDVCPLCFQSITTDHQHSLINAINKIFDDEAQNHIQELNSIVLSELPIYNFMSFSNVIDSSTQAKINNLVTDINKIIITYKQVIDSKKKNVFIPISFDNLKLTEKLIELKSIILECNKLIEEYNINITNINEIKNELITINDQIAYWSIKSMYDNYQKLINDKNKDENSINELTKEINDISNKIKDLNAKKKNLNLGLKEINDDLLLIFHTRKKLQLELDNGMYYVKSNGRRIEFNNLSVGEKNVIGLCYFFSLIRNGHSTKDVFKDEMFIVLDDPISSFDFSNKYGIYSYLKKILSELFDKNKFTKVIVLTHELETVMNLNNIRADLSFEHKNFIIKDKQLKKYDLKSSNYKNMLAEILERIKSNAEISSENINTARRILEAFTFFNYNKSINVFSREKEIFLTIPNDKIRDYLSSVVYRFVLNNESHTENSISFLTEKMDYDSFSEDEKKQVIKDTLILIYSLNSMHLKQVLEEEDFMLVKTWYDDLSDDYRDN